MMVPSADPLRRLTALGRLQASRLGGLRELIGESRQRLRVLAAGSAGRVLEGRRELGCDGLELGRVLLRQLLQLAEKLSDRGDP